MAQTLGRLTGLHSAFGAAKGDEKSYGDAVLSRYPFTWVGNHPIPSASSSRYQAMAVDVDLSKLYGDGVTVRFINTHFDWLDTLGSQEARLAAIAVIERAFLGGSTLPAVLTGDLNATPSSAPLSRLREHGWTYSHSTKEMLTWEATNPTKQIDYVLVKPTHAWRIVESRVPSEPVASDHLPVVTTLELIEPSPAVGQETDQR
jgi:endonuclease/exonuclease/phosphatase family metal-dependent hydrolase